MPASLAFLKLRPQGIELKEYLEHNEVHGNFYGTNIDAIQKIRENQQICLLDIDVKGAIDIYNSKRFNCNFIFVAPPSIKELERRLVKRGTETPESLRRRLLNAEREMNMAKECKIF